MSTPQRILVIGGGAAGFFAAITSAEKADTQVFLYEATPHLLSKVKISGGGRCNVTHACFEPEQLVKNYPRGGRELLGAFHRFQPRDTLAWFNTRGVETKTEEDGRMFPTSDNSESIVNALNEAAQKNQVKILIQRGVKTIQYANEKFEVELNSGEMELFDKVIIATGGNKSSSGLAIAESFGHTIIPPVPSLFTFHIQDNRLTDLAGLSVEKVKVKAGGTKLTTEGPLLLTHWGMSGPAILKLSAWGAREFAESNYNFTIEINWVPEFTQAALSKTFNDIRVAEARKQIATFSPLPIPQRLWERLLLAAEINPTTPWAHINNQQLDKLYKQLTQAEFTVTGKSMFKEEFVTCGGVKLSEINFKTMESRKQPGLFFAGEVLDIDGVTGGFNFQNAWTTGWLAGQAAAERP
ncbi:MAG: NAD(P)/FAD-dependent oxidoreductase [Opitutales bacterium]|nr:NAD(P)/FAD-dependent oxidoreductase [Opitutales bacterium]